LLSFVRAQRFERVGVFPYSLEPGTPAERLPDHLAEEVKQERRSQLMEAQQEVAFAWTRQRVGRELDVLIDGPDPEVPNHMLARSYADAPDIDCLVRVKGKSLQAGDLVRVKVTAADGYDLVARAIAQGR
jgi:ribosomal protein S12 methylthiotransferase